jgi:hypothetical protein
MVSTANSGHMLCFILLLIYQCSHFTSVKCKNIDLKNEKTDFMSPPTTITSLEMLNQTETTSTNIANVPAGIAVPGTGRATSNDKPTVFIQGNNGKKKM